jgi:hypothetical protein
VREKKGQELLDRLALERLAEDVSVLEHLVVSHVRQQLGLHSAQVDAVGERLEPSVRHCAES